MLLLLFMLSLRSFTEAVWSAGRLHHVILLLLLFMLLWLLSRLQKLAGLLEGFIASFRSTAQMVTMIGRQHMLPIVEHAGRWC